MPLISADARFFGIDLRALWQATRQAWRQLPQKPFLAWLTPPVPVRLLQADGDESLWLGAQLQPHAETASRLGKTPFIAVELPQDIVLQRTLTIPPMGEADTANAVQLELRSISPFPEADLAWGYTLRTEPSGARRIQAALTSRKQVAKYLETQKNRLPPHAQPEIWVRSQGPAPVVPIVIQGYGEQRRKAYAARQRNISYGLLLLAAALAGAIAITPTAQLRLRVIEAGYAYEALYLRSQPLMAKREALVQTAEQLKSLAELLSGRIEPLYILNKLTQVLPDDTYLQSFRLQGAKATIGGVTSNATQLMQTLSTQEGLRDVKAPSPATRLPGSPKESFTIEFTLDPKLYGAAKNMPITAQGSGSIPAPAPVQQAPAATAPIASTPPVPASPATPAPAAASGAAPAKPAAAAPAPNPARKGPVFGGTVVVSKPAPSPSKPASAP